ncbi:myrosinase 1-like [Cylas formicarius]|uniref:myrosinase 1-like n=1 Tax=Cylas formicarius TaxID=197179 RepID=UPI0029585C53|nr:myrosinase 1-like [Cylas formicarius]
MLLTVALANLLVICSSELSDYPIPKDFMLGVATAAYQIEGAWNEDGKGESVWDWYSHTFPERIDNAATGDVACDSYHKWEEDVALLKELGVDHYRFSLSWSRILPEGTINYVNEAGIEYYRKLLQGLADNNITPLVTLFHWDTPRPLHELGGWTNPLIADYFAEYARLCFERFGDLVQNWITINEPQTTCVQGYTEGIKAPGYSDEAEGVYLCAYTHVLAHAKAYHIYDEEFRAMQKGRITIVVDSMWCEPASDSSEDKEAAETEMEFIIGLYANPIYNGNWPQVVIDRVGNRSLLEGYPRSRLPEFTKDEIDYINGTFDFFALNSYSTNYIYHQIDVTESIGNGSYLLDSGIGAKVNSTWKSIEGIGWVNDVPWGFRKLLNWVHNHYNKPDIIITENGWADLTGDLQDQDRIDYVAGHISAILDAINEDGVRVFGYTVWSFMDNFEWTNGYNEKLGLYQVDFDSPDRTRTAKDSAKWYQKIIKDRCLVDKCQDASL